jgi:integrase
LAAHEVDPATSRKLRSQLRSFEQAFGDRPLQTLEEYELAIWKRTVPHDVFRAARQMLAQAERWHWVPLSPAAGIRAPKPRRREVVPPAWETVQLLGEEIDLRLAALPVFAAGTGLRIEEWIALERRDLDLEQRVVRVRRVRTASGEIRELGADGSKTWRQRREVPLRGVVVETLAAALPRIDTPLVFAAPRGGHLHPVSFHRKFWRPALLAAGLQPFPPKDLRHVYASESLAAGIDLFTLSRRMGTSLAEIDATYGHLVGDSHQRELAQLDAYDAAQGRSAQGQ